ncbi:probable cleavage and polyadenylation specificity factor subunit 2 [Achroia grisella]|uniref:probable cleavage and polyadenylation specificity factor subunit 2 n=1 Tax=Achroia grisella TaxID=688607 RepID=UPI0027D311A2|nr:probable cleavage and polyadenylation specificity factor subunit 2 [Achroia grisella]XP_059058234.1 probable cleavage and polyadenylation specificity factor subunit 2 [Achroia grisella]
MTSIIKVHCISGAGDESPPCYVLQIDEFKFLLDCGWDEKFDMNFIGELKRHVNSIDAVLLSHSDPLHLGALPYAVGKLGLNCPIYATLPIYKMGQMFMYDLYQAHRNVSDFDLFTLDDVDAAFDRITQLKYNQSIDMKGKGLGVRITPLPAGHSLGGTVWRIAAPGEEDIVYAPDFNHKKERHLNGCEIEKLMRPSLLLLGAMNADYVQQRRRLRDEKLMTTILTTLRGGGCVLVCTDTAGRVLELAHMLDQLWRNKDSGLVAYSLLLLSNVSYNVVEFAKSQIEWMSDKLTRAFEGARSNPFALRHLQLCHSVAEVVRTPGPKVVLASFPDLETGFARDLFLQWAPHPSNSIVLTARTSPGTLARDLAENGGDRILELPVRRRLRLEGAELEDYLQHQRLKINNSIKEETAGLSSDSDSEGELEMWVVTGRHDIPARGAARPSGCFKANKRHHAMYPFHEERTRTDDYGEIIKPEDYRLAEIVDAEGEIRDVPPAPPPKIEPDEEMIEIPSKCVTTMRQVHVKANIQYIELEGRCDGESLLRVVAQAKPRRVLGLRAGPAALATLRKHCEAEGIEKIFIPKCGETIDATTESHIYQVKLTDSLLSQLSWRSAGDAELAWVAATLAPRARSRETAPGDEESSMEVSMSLEPCAGSAHAASFVNSVRLSELRAAVARLGLAAEFVGGALECCNGTLAIRRLENGRVALEGVLSEEYYKVRELLYDQFAIV